MYSSLTLFALFFPMLNVILEILGIYALITFIKAMNIYIRKNS